MIPWVGLILLRFPASKACAKDGADWANSFAIGKQSSFFLVNLAGNLVYHKNLVYRLREQRCAIALEKRGRPRVSSALTSANVYL